MHSASEKSRNTAQHQLNASAFEGRAACSAPDLLFCRRGLLAGFKSCLHCSLVEAEEVADDLNMR